MNWIAYVIWQCLAYTVHLFMVVYYIYVKIRKDQHTCNYLELLGVLLGGAVEANFSQVQGTWKILEVPCQPHSHRAHEVGYVSLKPRKKEFKLGMFPQQFGNMVKSVCENHVNVMSIPLPTFRHTERACSKG